MPKTLADMTAEERAECVGMWANVEDDYISVIAEVNGTGTCVIVCPVRQGCDATYPNNMVTPRFDLPRAWTPDGEPELTQALAEEEYQYGVTYTGVKHGGHHIEWVEPTGDAEWDKETLHLLASRWERKGQSPKIVRRRVSAPEVINE